MDARKCNRAGNAFRFRAIYWHEEGRRKKKNKLNGARRTDRINAKEALAQRSYCRRKQPNEASATKPQTARPLPPAPLRTSHGSRPNKIPRVETKHRNATQCQFEGKTSTNSRRHRNGIMGRIEYIENKLWAYTIQTIYRAQGCLRR